MQQYNGGVRLGMLQERLLQRKWEKLAAAASTEAEQDRLLAVAGRHEEEADRLAALERVVNENLDAAAWHERDSLNVELSMAARLDHAGEAAWFLAYAVRLDAEVA